MCETAEGAGGGFLLGEAPGFCFVGGWGGGRDGGAEAHAVQGRGEVAGKGSPGGEDEVREEELDVCVAEGVGKSTNRWLATRRIVVLGRGVTYLYMPVNMSKRFMSSSPNPQPPVQKTSKPTQTCQPNAVPKKNSPSPPWWINLFHKLPPLPAPCPTNGRMLVTCSRSSSFSSSESSLGAALAFRGYGLPLPLPTSPISILNRGEFSVV